MKNVKFRGIPRQKDEFRGEIPRLKFRGKTQIPRLGSKFRGPRKTVGPTYNYKCKTVKNSLNIFQFFQRLTVKVSKPVHSKRTSPLLTFHTNARSSFPPVTTSMLFVALIRTQYSSPTA